MRIDKKYNGPPHSGNGGYVCGLMSESIEEVGPLEITLLAPPPLEKDMELISDGDQSWSLIDEDRVIAKAKTKGLDIAVPYHPTMKEAEACAETYPGHDRHVFPTCFVCGPARSEGDGLRLFTGRSETGTYVAAPFRIYADWVDEAQMLRERFVWAALDCPGAYAISQLHEDKPLVLGRFEVIMDHHISVSQDESMIAVAWFLGAEGKKHYAGSALIDDQGKVYARAMATWIAIDPEKFLANQNAG